QQSAKLSTSGVSLPQTFSNAFPSLPTPGNDVLFVCAWYGDMPASVTIAGTVATLDANYSPFVPGLPYRLLIYRARVGATPNRNVVISGSASGTYMSGACLEVTPLADSPVDQYA